MNAATGDGPHSAAQPFEIAAAALSVGFVEALGCPEAAHERVRAEGDCRLGGRIEIDWRES
jgi:hypothetical protein